MDLQTLRAEVRDLLSEDSSNLSDPTLDTLIERATQRIESAYGNDYGVTPRQMISYTTGTISADGLQLPSDFLRARVVKIGDNHYRYQPLENMPNTTAGEDSEVHLTYYAKLDKLSADTDTNWLLDLASRVYVYGTAIEYTLWNRESEGDRARYIEEFSNALEETGRANSPRPSGGFGRSKGRQHGFYSVRGDYMIFGYS